MNQEEVQMLAFQMIVSAGDALDCYYQAIIASHAKKTEVSKQKFDEGNQKFNECHLVQTKLIQAESRGESIPYSLIMTHAQDHFTTATNWQRFAQLMINDFSK